jgi:hypothetical protein
MPDAMRSSPRKSAPPAKVGPVLASTPAVCPVVTAGGVVVEMDGELVCTGIVLGDGVVVVVGGELGGGVAVDAEGRDVGVGGGVPAVVVVGVGSALA